MSLGTYKSALTHDSFFKDVKTCIAKEPVKIGEYKVQVGEIITLGYGNGGQESALGRIYMLLKDDAGNQVHGTVRIQVATAQNMPVKVCYESRTEHLASGASDITKQIPFNENELNVGITQNNHIQVYFIADEACKVDASKSVAVMSISRTMV